MCDQESHLTLTQPDHFMRHALKVEQGYAALRLGRQLGEAGLEGLKYNAAEALQLEPRTASTQECHRMLTQAAAGSLVSNAS